MRSMIEVCRAASAAPSTMKAAPNTMPAMSVSTGESTPASARMASTMTATPPMLSVAAPPASTA
jgi:hypothetical protein